MNLRSLVPVVPISAVFALSFACLDGGTTVHWHPQPLPPPTYAPTSSSSSGNDAGPVKDGPFDAGTPDQNCKLNSGPDNTPVVTAAHPPAPISGGTLLVTRDGKRAVIADPDRDRVSIVELATLTHSGDVALQPGDEPGRLVEDGAGRIHVALRRSGAVVAIDPVALTVLDRRQVCGAPRGIAWSQADDLVHVACAEGALVSLPASGGAPVRTLQLGADLRDVIVHGTALLVSRMRSAELLNVDSEGSLQPALFARSPVGTETPEVAWRTIATSKGARMFHQVASNQQVSTFVCGGYGGNVAMQTGPIVQSAITDFDEVSGAWKTTLAGVPDLVLPVDAALSEDEGLFAAVGAGNRVLALNLQGAATQDTSLTCNPFAGYGIAFPDSEPVATAIAGNNLVLVQTRDAKLHVLAINRRTLAANGGGCLSTVKHDVVALGGESAEDTGHRLFHQATLANLACASCHPEGLDDGHVWSFTNAPQRRTQFLGGGVMQTAPFHWNGELPDLDALTQEVMTKRMMGPVLDGAHVAALGAWIDSIPAPAAPPSLDAEAVARGKALFESSDVGCVTCHAGPKHTNNGLVDVGTGGIFQVPTLAGLATRTPFMHDGCAKTLKDRFTDATCGGGDFHGQTSQLTDSEIDDLVAYLETF